MKKVYMMELAQNITREQHSVIRKALQDHFDWIAVDLPGVWEFTDINAWRKNGHRLTLNDQSQLETFTAGVLAALTIVSHGNPKG